MHVLVSLLRIDCFIQQNVHNDVDHNCYGYIVKDLTFGIEVS